MSWKQGLLAQSGLLRLWRCSGDRRLRLASIATEFNQYSLARLKWREGDPRVYGLDQVWQLASPLFWLCTREVFSQTHWAESRPLHQQIESSMALCRLWVETVVFHWPSTFCSFKHSQRHCVASLEHHFLLVKPIEATSAEDHRIFAPIHLVQDTACGGVHVI